MNKGKVRLLDIILKEIRQNVIGCNLNQNLDNYSICNANLITVSRFSTCKIGNLFRIETFLLFFVGLKNLMDQVIEIDQGQGRSQGHSEGQGTSSCRSSQAFQIQNYMLHRMSILEVTLFWQVFLEQNYFLRYCQYFFLQTTL